MGCAAAPGSTVLPPAQPDSAGGCRGLDVGSAVGPQ